MSLAREVTTVGGGTLISRLLAYVRDAGIAALLGAGPFSEAFFAVLQVVNFFRRLLAEGALNGAFVPIWLRLRAGDDGAAAADRFTRRSLAAMSCAAGAVALLVFVFAGFVVGAVAPGFDAPRTAAAQFYLHIVTPYILLAGLIAVIAAALNAERRVVAVTVSTITFNAVMLMAIGFALGVGDQFTTGVRLAGGVVAAGLIQFAVTALAWLFTGKRRAKSGGRHDDQVRRFFRRAVPSLVAAGIPQLKLIVAAAVASSAPAAVSWLYYANRLYELPLGVASVAIATVIVPRIAASVRGTSVRAGGVGAADAKAAADAQSRAFEITLALALPSAVAFAVLAGPIAAGLFEHGAFGPDDTAAVAAALAAMSAGLPGHVLEKVLGAVSFAHVDTRTPMLTALAGLATATVGALLLFPHYGHVGVAAAIATSGWVGASLLAVILARRGWLRIDRDGRRRIPRIVAATLVMAAAILMARHAAVTLSGPVPSGSARVMVLAVLVATGLAVYLAAIQGFGVARLRDLAAAIGERAPRGP